MQAKNYAAQVVKSLDSFIPKYKNLLDQIGDKYHGLELASLSMIKTDIKKAIHFTMPDGGCILDDNLRGLKTTELRLPFPVITIECFIKDKGDTNGGLTPTSVEKRLILATETTTDTMRSIIDACKNVSLENNSTLSFLKEGMNNQSFDRLFESDRIITVYAFFMVDGQWIPNSSNWMIPSKWDDLKGTHTIQSLTEIKKNTQAITGKLGHVCPTMFDRNCARVGEYQATQEAVHDISGEVVILLELLEALSCKNVVIDDAKIPKIGERGIDNKNLPFYQTKILTIKTTQKQEIGTKTGTHESPRQHLRRGHIRRLENGNIWVNACVVGDSSKGVIKKSYNVVA